MKITRSQKDAVISLLHEKLDEKQEIEFEKFKKENEKSVRKNYKELIDNYNKVRVLTEDLNKAYKNYRKVVNGIEEFKYNYRITDTNVVQYNKTEDDFVNQLCKQICPKIEYPDFSKVGRELELASLNKDFDVNEFLRKYLEK